MHTTDKSRNKFDFNYYSTFYFIDYVAHHAISIQIRTKNDSFIYSHSFCFVLKAKTVDHKYYIENYLNPFVNEIWKQT